MTLAATVEPSALPKGLAGGARLRRHLPSPPTRCRGYWSIVRRRWRASTNSCSSSRAPRGCDAVRLLPRGGGLPDRRARRRYRATTRAAAERADWSRRAGAANAAGVALLFDRARAARGLELARVGARRRRAHPGQSAHLAGRGGHRGAAGEPGRLSPPLRAAARPARSGGGNLLRPFRRGLRPLPGEFRFHHARRGRDSFAPRCSRSATWWPNSAARSPASMATGFARSELLPEDVRARS